MLWMKIAHSDNIVLRTIYILNNNEFVAISSKYDIDLCNLSECVIKQNIWSVFADTVIFSMYYILFAILCVFMFLCLCCDTLGLCSIVTVCMFLLLMATLWRNKVLL